MLPEEEEGAHYMQVDEEVEGVREVAVEGVREVAVEGVRELATAASERG